MGRGTETAAAFRRDPNCLRSATHKWDDNYDFEAMQPGGAGALALQESRGARPFKFGATWTQRVEGTVRIRNGELSEPRFQWQDVNN